MTSQIFKKEPPIEIFHKFIQSNAILLISTFLRYMAFLIVPLNIICVSIS